MRKQFAILIAALFFVSAVPITSAETIEQAYLTSSGAAVRPVGDLHPEVPGGLAITVCPDAVAWPLDPDWDPVNDPLGDDTGPRGCPNPDPIIPHIGSAALFPENAWGSAQVTPSDDVTGSNAPISVCLWNPEGTGNICGQGGHLSSGLDCGSAFVSTGGEYLAERATVFVWSFVVNSDFSVCAATSGSVVADFF